MSKGIKKKVEKFVKEFRQSDFYQDRLHDQEALNVVNEVNDYLPEVDVCQDFINAVKCLVNFIARGMTPVRLISIGALAYFILPPDIVPDYIPIAGFADDATVMGVALRQIAGIYRDML